jgi:hypothetical protein
MTMIKNIMTAYHVIANFSFYYLSNLLMAQSLYDKDICIGECNNASEAKKAAHLLNQALDTIKKNI